MASVETTIDPVGRLAEDFTARCRRGEQPRLTDYTEFCTHLGRAYAALTREWSEGHRLAAGRARRPEDHPVGVELFQIEAFDPIHRDRHEADPIQIALGILKGQLDPASGHAIAAV